MGISTYVSDLNASKTRFINFSEEKGNFSGAIEKSLSFF